MSECRGFLVWDPCATQFNDSCDSYTCSLGDSFQHGHEHPRVHETCKVKKLKVVLYINQLMVSWWFGAR